MVCLADYLHLDKMIKIGTFSARINENRPTQGNCAKPISDLGTQAIKGPFAWVQKDGLLAIAWNLNSKARAQSRRIGLQQGEQPIHSARIFRVRGKYPGKVTRKLDIEQRSGFLQKMSCVAWQQAAIRLLL